MKISNNGKKKIRVAGIDIDKENIRPGNINKQKLTTPNCMSQNGLLSESFSTFKEVIFSEFRFLVGTPVVNIKYGYP